MQKYKTIQIPEEIHHDLKVYCAQRGLLMTDIIVSVLANLLSAKPSTGPQKPPAAPHRTPHQFVKSKESIPF